MGGSTLTSPASILIPVQAQVFEVIANTGTLTGPIQDLARRYGGDPERFVGQERVIIRIRIEQVIRHD